jgi:nucleotide-binding universal stress UspA family protein
MVLGSTSSGVVRHAHCPTVVLHRSEADTEEQT